VPVSIPSRNEVRIFDPLTYEPEATKADGKMKPEGGDLVKVKTTLKAGGIVMTGAD